MPLPNPPGHEAYITDIQVNREIKASDKTLRDEFAMAALQGMITNQGYKAMPLGVNEQIHWAYEYADRMLAERAKADNQSWYAR